MASRPPPSSILVAFVGLSAACGWHVGAPPPTIAAVQVGEIRAPAAEPGLPEALARGLGSALAARGALGDGPEVDVRVVEATAEVVAAGEDAQVHRARLRVEFQVRGATPLVLSGERSYVVRPGDTLGAAGARAAAFASLAHDLAADAADRVLFPPSPPPGTPSHP